MASKNEIGEVFIIVNLIVKPRLKHAEIFAFVKLLAIKKNIHLHCHDIYRKRP